MMTTTASISGDAAVGAQRPSVAAHTPGPWERTNDTVHIPYRGPHHKAAAFAGTAENARLIAAAPDMLEALRGVRVYLERGEPHKASELARLAIACATGAAP